MDFNNALPCSACQHGACDSSIISILIHGVLLTFALIIEICSQKTKSSKVEVSAQTPCHDRRRKLTMTKKPLCANSKHVCLSIAFGPNNMVKPRTFPQCDK